MSSLHSYHDLLQEYFDEGLSGVHEEVLFAELGRNGEMRREFSRMMRMHKTVQADAAHLKAPAYAADDIMRRITAMPVPQSVSAFIIVRRIGAFAATAVLAVLATIAVVRIGGLEHSNADVLRPVVSTTARPPAATHAVEPLPPTGIPAAVAQPTARHRANRTVVEYHKSFPAFGSEEPIQHSTPSNAITHASISRSPFADQSIRSGKIASVETPISMGSDDGLLRYARLQEEEGTVALSLRGMSVGGAAVAVSGQMSAGVFYEVNGNHAFGIEAGQEPFVDVSTVDVDGEAVEFRSTETLPWAMAVYRLSLPELGIESTVYPFAQIGAGAARSSALGKAQLGIVLQPEHRVVFSFGLESTVLFRSQASPLTALRWTYGVGVKL